MEAVDTRERARRLAGGLAGREVPFVTLRAFNGEPVRLPHAVALGAVIYTYPGVAFSLDGGSESRAADAAQHRAFDRHEHELQAHCLRPVGVSSESAREQLVSVLENRVCHELWSDPDLQFARALGLPTFDHEGVGAYRRLTLVVRAGRIEKAFFPVSEPQRGATQVICWLKATGR